MPSKSCRSSRPKGERSTFSPCLNSDRRSTSDKEQEMERCCRPVMAAAVIIGWLIVQPIDAQSPPASDRVPTRVLRIAADPNNLPFSNKSGDGFENKIADLLARELNAKTEYVWMTQGRGFFRETLS